MIRKLKYGLPKADRLHHRSLVNSLFENGHAEYAYPLRMMYRTFDADDEALKAAGVPVPRLQFMVNIPKKKQRRAVNRVLLRRRVREAYRRLRPQYEDMIPDGMYLSLAMLYMSEKIAPYSKIADKADELLKLLVKKINNPEQDAGTE